MDQGFLSNIGRYEWAIMLLLPLALLLWEWRNIRREIRRARSNEVRTISSSEGEAEDQRPKP